MNEQEETGWLTVQQVADLMHMPAHTVRRLLHKGTLPGVYLGTRVGWRIRRSDVDALATTHQKGQADDGHPA